MSSLVKMLIAEEKLAEQGTGCYFKRDVSNPLASVLSYSATARPALAQLVNARPARFTFNGDLFTSVKTKLL